MKHRMFYLIVALFAMFAAQAVQAALRMPRVFGDHMVLQRDLPVAIWGTSDPAGKVTVAFAGQTRSATADAASGRWKVELAPLEARADGADLTVTNGTDTIVLHDVLVGEVWFASGQSNMQFAVSGSEGAQQIIAAADFPQVRMFQGALTPAATPQDDVGGDWQSSTPENVGRFSAVGYHFALKLHRELGVPVGVIRSAWGGKPVQTFTSREALASIPEGKKLLDAHDAAVAKYDPELAKKQTDAGLRKHQAALAAWEKKPAAKRGRKPVPPGPVGSPAAREGMPTTLYNGMIHPYVGYTIRGAIWYQGEGNAKTIASAKDYGKLFPLMIRDWRKRWGSEFSFLWVQLADFKAPATEPGASDPWALLQDVQRRSLSVPKTGMAVINDIGDAKDIHPKNKKDVGERLARWALAHDYGKEVIACGPLYQSSVIKDGKVRVTFQYAGKGLKTRDDKPVRRMEISGKDGVWHWADVTIDGDSVLVSSPAVPEPAAVRYAWASNPEGANLVNSESLPASIFTTLADPE